MFYGGSASTKREAAENDATGEPDAKQMSRKKLKELIFTVLVHMCWVPINENWLAPARADEGSSVPETGTHVQGKVSRA
jgi:hypothetical protein